MKKIISVGLLMCSVAYAQEEATPTTTQTYTAAEGAGKTLPGGVLRVRVPTRFFSGKKGFDGEGDSKDNNLKTSVVATGVVVEYGVNDRLSLQLLAPMILSNKLTLDKNGLRKSAIYKANYEKMLTGIANYLALKGACPSVDACTAYINSGGVIPSDSTISFGDEAKTIKGGTKVSTAIDEILMGSVEPADGETGLGDIEIGALYALPIPSSVKVSVGGGFRFPTGKFEDVSLNSKRPTGRGTLDLGLRLNVDYTIVNGVEFSWQHQSEKMLNKGKYHTSGIVDNTKIMKEEDFEREGVRNVGFVKLGWGLGNVSQNLALLGLYSSYNYDFDAAKKFGDADAGPRSNIESVTAGVVVDGLAYQFPAQLEIEYNTPVSGKNQTIATSMLGINLKGYYRF